MQRIHSHYLSVIIFFLFFSTASKAQYKSYVLSGNDTINRIDKKNLKQGKWVVRIEALRGEPGYEDEGMYKNDAKEGIWRRYTLMGDFIGLETYSHGGKDGLQQYYTPVGELVREESWKGYNPDAPFDTIPIYGTGNGEIIDYKIVKAEQYSVKNGPWKYYDPASGRLIKSEEWERNVIKQPRQAAADDESEAAAPPKKKEMQKTPAMLEWEKKNKGKKKGLRDGNTGL